MLIGLTGPSSFSSDCMAMLENYFQANFVLLYHNDENNINEWLSKVNGVVFAGGVDIHPTAYGECVINNASLSKFDLMRDLRELSILNVCKNKKIPMLGICRGHQLLGISHGMRLLPDISCSQIGHNPAKTGVTLSKDEPMHYVKLEDVNYFKQHYDYSGSQERKAIDKLMNNKDEDKIWVNSFHHQGLMYAPKHDYESMGVKVLGLSRIDINKIEYIVELMEGTGDYPWISCQWHPEYDWDVNSPSRAILSRFKKMLS